MDRYDDEVVLALRFLWDWKAKDLVFMVLLDIDSEGQDARVTIS